MGKVWKVLAAVFGVIILGVAVAAAAYFFWIRDDDSDTVSAAAAHLPAGPYSPAFVGPNKPNVGAPEAAARCIRPESLPTNRSDRATKAAISGRLNRPIKSIAFGKASWIGLAIAASASPGPATTAGTAPGIWAAARRWKRATNRSAGQTFGCQLAVGARMMTG